MFYLLIIVTGCCAAASMLGILVVLWNIVSGLGSMSTDDAMALLSFAWAAGASAFSFLAPASRRPWLARFSANHRIAGRLLGTVLGFYAFYVGGYLIERCLDETKHEASWLSVVIAGLSAIGLLVADLVAARARVRPTSAHIERPKQER